MQPNIHAVGAPLTPQQAVLSLGSANQYDTWTRYGGSRDADNARRATYVAVMKRLTPPGPVSQGMVSYDSVFDYRCPYVAIKETGGVLMRYMPKYMDERQKTGPPDFMHDPDVAFNDPVWQDHVRERSAKPKKKDERLRAVYRYFRTQHKYERLEDVTAAWDFEIRKLPGEVRVQHTDNIIVIYPAWIKDDDDEDVTADTAPKSAVHVKKRKGGDDVVESGVFW